MQTRLTESVVALEERLRSSPMHKMHAHYTISAKVAVEHSTLAIYPEPDPTVANFLFRNRHHMEKARQLEAAYAAGLISLGDFCDAFPHVLFVAVNVHYDINNTDIFGGAETFTSSGVNLVKPGLEESIEGMTIELCRGAKVYYVHDDRKWASDVIVAVTIARSGTVSGIYKTDYRPPFSFRTGTGVLEVFETMERYVRANGRRV